MALAIVTLADEILAMVAPPGLMEAFVTECLHCSRNRRGREVSGVKEPSRPEGNSCRQRSSCVAMRLSSAASVFLFTIPPMDYLLKTEPTVYSFANLERDKTTVWDGVTNPAAVKHLREMKPESA